MHQIASFHFSSSDTLYRGFSQRKWPHWVNVQCTLNVKSCHITTKWNFTQHLQKCLYSRTLLFTYHSSSSLSFETCTRARVRRGVWAQVRSFLRSLWTILDGLKALLKGPGNILRHITREAYPADPAPPVYPSCNKLQYIFWLIQSASQHEPLVE